MGAFPAATAPATFDSSAYLGNLLRERTDGRVPAKDRDRANEAFRRDVRERVMSRRRELGYTRDDMVRLLAGVEVRITFNAYAKWEREAVPLDRLTVLADVLDVTPEWLLHGDAPHLADLQSQLEGLSAQTRRLEQLVSQLAADRETLTSRPA